MAHIVPFRTAAARVSEETEARRTAGAEIVIFPGVRRERHLEAPTGEGKTTRRDWLELTDEPPAEPAHP